MGRGTLLWRPGQKRRWLSGIAGFRSRRRKCRYGIACLANCGLSRRDTRQQSQISQFRLAGRTSSRAREAARHRTIVAEKSYGAFWNVRKGRNQQWDAVIKQADTALQ